MFKNINVLSKLVFAFNAKPVGHSKFAGPYVPAMTHSGRYIFQTLDDDWNVVEKEEIVKTWINCYGSNCRGLRKSRRMDTRRKNAAGKVIGGHQGCPWHSEEKMYCAPYRRERKDWWASCIKQEALDAQKEKDEELRLWHEEYSWREFWSQYERYEQEEQEYYETERKMRKDAHFWMDTEGYWRIEFNYFTGWPDEEIEEYAWWDRYGDDNELICMRPLDEEAAWYDFEEDEWDRESNDRWLGFDNEWEIREGFAYDNILYLEWNENENEPELMLEPEIEDQPVCHKWQMMKQVW